MSRARIAQIRLIADRAELRPVARGYRPTPDRSRAPLVVHDSQGRFWTKLYHAVGGGVCAAFGGTWHTIRVSTLRNAIPTCDAWLGGEEVAS